MRSHALGLVVLVFLGCTPGGAPQSVASKSAAPISSATTPTSSAHRKLRVALYPWVPDRAGVFQRVAARFRSVRADVELEDVDLANNYLDSILQTDAQVLEIDSASLDDSYRLKRLGPLPASVSVRENDFAPVARTIGVRDGVRYAVPHWLNSNYLYTTKTLAPQLKTWSGTKAALGKSVTSGQGLLIDLLGRYTLGELYFDSTFDALNDLSAVLQTVEDPAKRFQPAVDAIVDAQALCTADYCRVGSFHDTGYSHEFARKRGAAFVGGSFQLYFLLDEVRNQCGPGACISEDDIEILPFSFSDKGHHPTAFVDSLAINASSCTGDCIEDAAALIAMMNDDATTKAILLPADKTPPLYLLPARMTDDATLNSAAPLYSKLRAIIDGAVAVQGPELISRLRKMGEAINEDKRMRAPTP